MNGHNILLVLHEKIDTHQNGLYELRKRARIVIGPKHVKNFVVEIGVVVLSVGAVDYQKTLFVVFFEKLRNIGNFVPINGLEAFCRVGHGDDSLGDVREVQVEVVVDEPDLLFTD